MKALRGVGGKENHNQYVMEKSIFSNKKLIISFAFLKFKQLFTYGSCFAHTCALLYTSGGRMTTCRN